MAARFLQKTSARSLRPDSTIDEAFRRYRCGAAEHPVDFKAGIAANHSLQQCGRCLADLEHMLAAIASAVSGAEPLRFTWETVGLPI